MNILIDNLPKKFKNVNLNTDFRNWVAFEILLQDKNKTDEEKFGKIIDLTIKDNVEVLLYKLNGNEKEFKELMDYILKFYAGSFDERELKRARQNESKENNKKLIYSFEYDADYIFSSFYECYGIDLTTTKMHWWKFKALLKGLNEECLFSKILGYRSMKISSKMSKEEKKFYKEKKRIYALPDLRSEEEKEEDFANSLLNMCGG